MSLLLASASHLFNVHVPDSVYRYYSSEVFAIVPFLVGPPGIYISNLDVAHQILGNGRSALTFVKSQSSPYLLEYVALS